MSKDTTIVLIVFLCLMLAMAVLGYIGYDNWQYMEDIP